MKKTSDELAELPAQKTKTLLMYLLSSNWLLSLLLAVLLLIGFTWLGTKQQNSQTLLQQQHDITVQSAADQQQQALLLDYYNAISALLTNNNLIQSHTCEHEWCRLTSCQSE